MSNISKYISPILYITLLDVVMSFVILLITNFSLLLKTTVMTFVIPFHILMYGAIMFLLYVVYNFCISYKHTESDGRFYSGPQSSKQTVMERNRFLITPLYFMVWTFLLVSVIDAVYIGESLLYWYGPFYTTEPVLFIIMFVMICIMIILKVINAILTYRTITNFY